jgi:hypothetical protein
LISNPTETFGTQLFWLLPSQNSIQMFTLVLVGK